MMCSVNLFIKKNFLRETGRLKPNNGKQNGVKGARIPKNNFITILS